MLPTLPLPTLPLSIRPATMDDIPFMDALQKKHTRQVGWMPTKQFEGKIKAGHVLIADTACDSSDRRADGAMNRTLREPLGYLIGNDQYFKRDDLGIIYQINVVPAVRRGLIGASLLKAQFERSAYGCRLYCCWCAQDIEANRFWEALGFVPIAYRTGSMQKGRRREAGSVRAENASASPLTPHASLTPLSPRVHIFWQKRIRSGDETTPWWFPSKTSGGSIREDRIVLPIPAGTHWSAAQTLVLPAESRADLNPPLFGNEKNGGLKPALRKTKSKQAETPMPVRRNGLSFHIPQPGEVVTISKTEKTTQPRVKRSTDPRLAAAARELRDRWLEEVDAGRYLPATAKYEVGRTIEQSPVRKMIAA